jgi:DNA helicase MCM8
MQEEGNGQLQLRGDSPPHSWNLYFDSEYTADDRKALLIEELQKTLQTEAGWGLLQLAALRHGKVVVELSFEALQSIYKSADLPVALEVQPGEALACLAAAVHEVCMTRKLLFGKDGRWTIPRKFV